jgi:hypothetical protein
MSDEKANVFKVQYLYGRHGRICGGHKREGGCALPGEISPICQCVLSASRGAEMGRREVSRGHSRSQLDRTEGPNVKCVVRSLEFR